MAISSDVRRAFTILKLCCKIICTWPEPRHVSGHLDLVITRSKWWLTTINVLALLIPLALCVYKNFDDLNMAMQALSEFNAAFEVLCNLILCKIHTSRLQVLLTEIEAFIDTLTSKEQMIVRVYISRNKYFYTFVCSCFIMTGISFLFFPFFTGNKVPAVAWYPFSMDNKLVRIIFYILQSIVIYQAGLGIFTDCMIATLLWYSAARLELLGIELTTVNSDKEFAICIRKHQHMVS